MSSKLVAYGLLTNALMGILLYCMNIFIQETQDDLTRLYGIYALGTATIVSVCVFAWKWNTVRTWSFYLVFLPLFLTSSFDIFVIFDSWKLPSGLFLKSYLEAPDPHLHGIVLTLVVFLNGTLFEVINLAALYRLGKGLSARSLLLVPAMASFPIMSAYTVCCLTTGIPLHPLSASFLPGNFLYVVLLPLGALMMPRSFFLSHKKGSGIQSKLLRYVALPLLLSAGAVITGKALVLSGMRNEYLDIIRLNDPLIFLNDVEKTIPFISMLIWYYVLVSLPLLAISFVYHFKSTKPTCLWEVAVSNFSFIMVIQYIFIAGPFFWRTPTSLRVSPCNGIFWIINLIPVAAAAIQIASLLPYRTSLVSFKAKNKKTK